MSLIDVAFWAVPAVFAVLGYVIVAAYVSGYASETFEPFATVMIGVCWPLVAPVVLVIVLATFAFDEGKRRA